MTSTRFSLFIASQILQLLQGFQSLDFKQFIAFVNILAVEVFQVPLGQHKR
jgi:hypothetical protein